MQQNPILILTILLHLESTLMLEIPHLAGQIASLVNSFFTNAKGLVLPFQSCPSHIGERLDLYFRF